MSAQSTRRDFLKLAAASLTGASLAAVGLRPERADGRTTRSDGAAGRLVHGAFDGNCQWGILPA
ncbi:MAG: twin-arginine translocation signal domain-containing protein [Rubrobacter sp.]|nr:twin-arginine translocation signal domain-containing protein [Rubrobacter sp.]